MFANFIVPILLLLLQLLKHPDGQARLDRILCFCREILDMEELNLKSQFLQKLADDGMKITPSLASTVLHASVKHLLYARWVLDWKVRNGDRISQLGPYLETVLRNPQPPLDKTA